MSRRSRHARDRWQRALTVLRRLERRTALAPGWRPRTYEVHGDTARALDVPMASLPASLAKALGQEPDAGERPRGRVRADALQLGKFDVADEPRLRAFYVDTDGTPVTLRAQELGDPRQRGVLREALARREVAAHVPDLAPALYDVGADPRQGIAFLTEECIDGRHPRDRGEVQGAAVALVARLGRLHASVGIEQRRLSEVASEQIASGWAFAAEHLDVAGPLDAKVRALLRRDALLDVSLGHGDLVGSNLLLDERGRVVLIDWEHAGPLPIAFDLAKLHVQARNSAAAFAAFRRGLGNRVGRTRGGYRLHEQFALGHVQMLSWHEHRLARATEAGREKQLRQDTRRRLDRLEELLGSEPTLVLL